MKIIKISLIFYFTIISFQSYSQTIQKSEFTIELLNEDFESENNYFPTTTDYDTYLLVDNGDYLVSRNINKSQFINPTVHRLFHSVDITGGSGISPTAIIGQSEPIGAHMPKIFLLSDE